MSPVGRNASASGLDCGRFRGGFEAAYAARIVRPQDTPIARVIADAVGSDRYPKVDVEIEYPAGKVRSFSFDGKSARCAIITTPNPLVTAVITNTQGDDAVTLIDVKTGNTTEVFVSTPVACVASDVPGGRLFLATWIEVVAIGTNGVLWESRRVSLEGIKMLSYSAGYVRGIGNESSGQDVPFTIDATTGQATGGFCLDS